MKPLQYASGELVREGDHVLIRRALRSALEGIVVYVCSVSAPIQREVNDYGLSVKLRNGKERWYSDSPGADVVFSARSE